VLEGVWSPDGRRLVVARDDDGDVEADTVYVVGADETGLDRLTQGCDGGPLQAAWRPLRR
jgi:hypothetical protein